MFEERIPYYQDDAAWAIENVIRTLAGKAFNAIGVSLPGANPGLEALPEPESIGLQGIRDAVAGQLEGYHTILKAQLRKGSVDPFSGAAMATDMMGLLIAKAAAEGNREQLDEYVDTLGGLARGGCSELADASAAGELYVTAIHHGSEKAWLELHARLHEEKEIQAGLEGETLLMPHGTYLHGAIKEMIRCGLPAQELIDNYAINPARAVAYYADYLVRCRRQGAPAAHINEIEEIVTLKYKSLPDENAEDAYAVAKMLLHIRDDWLRWSTYSHLCKAQVNIQGSFRLAPAAYIEIMDALTLIPPEGTTLEYREYLREIAESGPRVIPGSRFEFWKIDAAVARGDSPKAVIDYAYALAASDDRRQSDEARMQLTADIDHAMAKHAARYAAIRDFVGAQSYIRAISDPRLVIETIASCMPYTQTLRQRSLLHVDDMTLRLNPGIALHARLVQLGIEPGPDTELMEPIKQFVTAPEAAVDSMHTTTEAGWPEQHKADIRLLERLLQRLAPVDALPLTKDLKLELSHAFETPGKHSRYYLHRAAAMHRYLSQQLVRLGDPEEARTWYAKLHAQNELPPNSVDRWITCMDLADLLFGRIR